MINKTMFTSFLAVFIFLFLFSGCIGDEESVELFVGGSNALEFTFASNAPPSEIRTGEPFDISVHIENKGEAKVPEETVYISLNNGAIFDVEPKDFIKVNKEKLSPIIKQDVGNLPGGYTHIEYFGLRYIGESITEESPVAISLETCYPYHTRTISQICVARKSEKSQVCEPLGEREVESSGAPVNVDLIKQQSNGIARISGASEEEKNKVASKIKIEISKTSGSRIYPLDYDCIKKAGVGGEGVVIGGMKVDNLDVNIKEACGDNVIYFDSDGIGKADCTLDIPNTYNDYEARFELVLSYKISDIINKQISILPY